MLLDAVDRIGLRNAGGFEDGWGDVANVRNWRRMPPMSLMRPGQDMATPWAVPPKCDGTCFIHLNGVSIAHAQGAAKCGNVRSDPQNSYRKAPIAHLGI